MPPTNPNPYQPPNQVSDTSDSTESEGGLDLTRPIPFAGCVGTEDLSVWLPGIPEKALPRLILGFIGYGVFAGVAVYYWIRSEIHVWPIAYLVVGLLMLNAWGRVCDYLLAWMSRDELTKSLDQSRPCRGYLDAEGGCWQSEEHILLFRWEEMQFAYTIDAGVMFGTLSANYLLPKRFFQSDEDFYHLAVALYKNNYPDFQVGIMQSDFDPLDFDGQGCMSRDEIAATKLWDEENWPIADATEQRITIDFEPTHEDFEKGELNKWRRNCIRDFFFRNLPMFASLLVWGVVDWFHYRDWLMIFAQPGAWLYLFFFGFFVVRQAREWIAYYQSGVRSDSIQLVLSNTACLTSISPHHLYWTLYRPEMELLANEQYVGWTVASKPEFGLKLRRNRIGAELADRVERLLRSSI